MRRKLPVRRCTRALRGCLDKVWIGDGPALGLGLALVEQFSMITGGGSGGRHLPHAPAPGAARGLDATGLRAGGPQRWTSIKMPWPFLKVPDLRWARCNWKSGCYPR